MGGGGRGGGGGVGWGWLGRADGPASLAHGSFTGSAHAAKLSSTPSALHNNLHAKQSSLALICSSLKELTNTNQNLAFQPAETGLRQLAQPRMIAMQCKQAAEDNAVEPKQRLQPQCMQVMHRTCSHFITICADNTAVKDALLN